MRRGSTQGNVPLWKRLAKQVLSKQHREGLKGIVVQIYARLDRLRVKECVYPAGVNLIGHIRGDFGLGESCRIVASLLKEVEIPFSIFNIPLNGPAKEEDMTWVDYEQKTAPYSINLVHLNPNELFGVVGKGLLKSRYNIGFWLWEVPEFPSEWSYAFELMDEIWTPADFVTQAIQKCTQKRVYTMPYGFRTPPTKDACTRRYFGLPNDQFLFLVSYDGNSVSERKNPLGAVRAYCKAFSGAEKDVGIVVKATHAREEELKKIIELLDGYNVYILTDSFDKAEFNSLIKSVDVYVSLHRAEGFGLVMAEAMLLGTPVIATAWSANMEFMNEDVACLVPAEIVALDEECAPYHKGDHWAQPDEMQAAKWMRKLYVNRTFGMELAEKAQRHMEENLTLQSAGKRMQERIEQIEKTVLEGKK